MIVCPEKLADLRAERGLTLGQMAKSLNVSKPTVWAWENGKAQPLPERIAAIAAVLGVAPEDLLASNNVPADAPIKDVLHAARKAIDAALKMVGRA